MFILCLGCLGFFCYFLYDYNSVRKIAGWMGALFTAGSLLLAAATVLLFWKNREVLLLAPVDGVWLAGGAFFSVPSRIYALFCSAL